MPLARLLALCTALLIAAPAAAQTVRGVVVDDAARPIPGMFVRLLTPAGNPARGGALTDAAGRFTIQAPAPGRYTVRAERVGYRAAAVVIDLAAGQTEEVRLSAAAQAFVLPVVEVRGERCTVRPGEDDAAYTLWEEARKALEVAAVLQDERQVEYTVRTFGSSLTVHNGRMRRENGEPRRVTGRPFHTLSPAELAQGGYVREDGDSLSFYGPDAQVLLSDEFLDTHCLYVDGRNSDGRTVALAFQPVRSRRTIDIRGVLRLDRRTGELRDLQYEYTDLRLDGQRVPAGGTVQFQRMPSGAWVVTEWRIRTTRVAPGAAGSSRATPGVGEIRSAGGQVTDVVLVDPAQPAP